MKRQLIAILSLITPLLVASVTQAANPNHVQQLLETRECQGCDLSGADLQGEHLIGVDLRDANLEGAKLDYTNLEGADLTGANLKSANLTGSMLTNATLAQTNLEQANLSQAQLYDTDVSGALMIALTLDGAEIFHTAIGIGGAYPETMVSDNPFISQDIQSPEEVYHKPTVEIELIFQAE
ncbi:MAG: pentapeptide repeat-containing protein [Microcystaceae cyanobacterium]